MPEFLLNVGATIVCPHPPYPGVTIEASQRRVLVGGESVATVKDVGNVAKGQCQFKVGTKPQPCDTVEWTAGAGRVRIGGQAALLKDSPGQCKSAEQTPQGPPNVLATQTRVKGA